MLKTLCRKLQAHRFFRTTARIKSNLEGEVFMSMFTKSKYTKLVPGPKNYLHAECALYRIIEKQVFSKGRLDEFNF